MARRQDQLVGAIRSQRQELRREIDAFLALEPLKTHVRDHPGPWLLGGVLAGALAARFLIAPLWQQRRRLAGGWVRSRLKTAVLGLASASVRPGPNASPPMREDAGQQPAAAGRR